MHWGLVITRKFIFRRIKKGEGQGKEKCHAKLHVSISFFRKMARRSDHWLCGCWENITPPHSLLGVTSIKAAQSPGYGDQNRHFASACAFCDARRSAATRTLSWRMGRFVSPFRLLACLLACVLACLLALPRLIPLFLLGHREIFL
jgi:hypothetical protein